MTRKQSISTINCVLNKYLSISHNNLLANLKCNGITDISDTPLTDWELAVETREEEPTISIIFNPQPQGSE